jgi:hypothetical protein
VLCRESPQVEGDGQEVPKSTPEPQVEWPLKASLYLAGWLPLTSTEAPDSWADCQFAPRTGGEERWHHERPLVLSSSFDVGGRFHSHRGGAR